LLAERSIEILRTLANSCGDAYTIVLTSGLALGLARRHLCVHRIAYDPSIIAAEQLQELCVLAETVASWAEDLAASIVALGLNIGGQLHGRTLSKGCQKLTTTSVEISRISI